MPWLFNTPERIDYNDIDEPIRELVRSINESKWLRTEDSCVGHPSWCHSCKDVSWGDNSDLYFRFVVNQADLFRLVMLADSIRRGVAGIAYWRCGLEYERMDELGTHWYFWLSYGRMIEDRNRAVDYFTRSFKDMEGTR